MYNNTGISLYLGWRGKPGDLFWVVNFPTFRSTRRTKQKWKNKIKYRNTRTNRAAVRTKRCRPGNHVGTGVKASKPCLLLLSNRLFYASQTRISSVPLCYRSSLYTYGNQKRKSRPGNIWFSRNNFSASPPQLLWQTPRDSVSWVQRMSGRYYTHRVFLKKNVLYNSIGELWSATNSVFKGV